MRHTVNKAMRQKVNKAGRSDSWLSKAGCRACCTGVGLLASVASLFCECTSMLQSWPGSTSGNAYFKPCLFPCAEACWPAKHAGLPWIWPESASEKHAGLLWIWPESSPEAKLTSASAEHQPPDLPHVESPTRSAWYIREVPI
eukprot:scaffold194085_cov20-Tisochrysis_lutea.AAC.2